MLNRQQKLFEFSYNALYNFPGRVTIFWTVFIVHNPLDLYKGL